MAKTGVLIASLIAGIVGSVWLLMCKPVAVTDVKLTGSAVEK